MPDFFLPLVIALLLTIAVEVVVAWLFGLRNRNAILAVVLLNIVTNPLLNYLLALNRYLDLISQELILTAVLEVAVVLVEWAGLIYVLGEARWKMLLLSILMNGCSYLAGVLIF